MPSLVTVITPLQLALIVAQSRDHNGVLSPIKLTALSDGLKRVAVQAKKMKGYYHIAVWLSMVICGVLPMYVHVCIYG